MDFQASSDYDTVPASGKDRRRVTGAPATPGFPGTTAATGGVMYSGVY